MLGVCAHHCADITTNVSDVDRLRSGGGARRGDKGESHAVLAKSGQHGAQGCAAEPSCLRPSLQSRQARLQERRNDSADSAARGKESHLCDEASACSGWLAATCCLAARRDARIAVRTSGKFPYQLMHPCIATPNLTFLQSYIVGFVDALIMHRTLQHHV